jgi:hypothetical protein
MITMVELREVAWFSGCRKATGPLAANLLLSMQVGKQKKRRRPAALDAREKFQGVEHGAHLVVYVRLLACCASSWFANQQPVCLPTSD